MAGLAHPHCSERSSDRMASLLGQIRRAGSLLPRRSASKYLLVEHRKASIGITASIAKLTESAGTSEPSERTEYGVVSSKAIDVRLSVLRQTRSIRLGLGGTGNEWTRAYVTFSNWPGIKSGDDAALHRGQLGCEAVHCRLDLVVRDLWNTE